MSSVVVGWTGRCQDKASRARLIGHLHRLAETSDGFLRARAPERRAASNPLRAGAQRRPNIEYLSQPARGRIVLAQGVVPNAKAMVAAAGERSIEAAEHPGIGGASLMLEDARLSGIDFKLYDPRDLHPWADRLSFVFLETEAAPFLDGTLVKIDRGEVRKAHPDPLIRGASAYLSGPSIELQSYLEDWSDLLLSWVKYFFVEDLAWRRREEMQGYDDYRDVFLDVDTTLGKERAEQATFDAILATFAQHAEHWSEEVAAGAAV